MFQAFSFRQRTKLKIDLKNTNLFVELSILKYLYVLFDLQQNFIYIYIYIYMKVKWVAKVEDDQKAYFSIATTQRCWGKCHFFSLDCSVFPLIRAL